ncbi:VanZ family protein [Vagococcus coleopterorum]|uniref:VanZ family protein n=1 Tax=Vagococcus coleopterorum TaxID=2714946 RepID=A0A6G8ALJ5_9ENTE|nr:VanZ family protein [Vagococcus coleopterorum]QIL45832.1 VanZ family protein [Vagococcus coleopterorum]
MAVSKKIKNANIYLYIAGLMMVILFISSSQTFEQQDQSGLISKILGDEPFFKSLNNVSFMYGGEPVSISDSGYVGFIQFFVRKLAHFISYFVIGGAGYLGLQPRIRNVGLTAFVSWLAATGYAGLDEYHQMVTGGRSPLFEDVILDSIGAATAIGICLVVVLVKHLRKKRR